MSIFAHYLSVVVDVLRLNEASLKSSVAGMIQNAYVIFFLINFQCLIKDGALWQTTSKQGAVFASNVDN